MSLARPITLAETNLILRIVRGRSGFSPSGMTGLWQVKGRNRLSYASRKRLDLFSFARRGTAALYFRILLRSVAEVLSGRGAC